MNSKLEVVKKYFSLIEQFRTDESEYTNILHAEVEQTEYPNWLTAKLTISDRATLFERSKSGSKLLASQRYDIQRSYECDETVITEVIWTAVIATDVGSFKSGQKLEAYFCCVFDFKNGLIHRQRNYDCFERF